MRKSTVDEIRRRFDADVERFSNLESGQSATIDAPLVLELVAAAAAATNPGATHLLDVGCGAGNYALKLLERLPGMSVDLVDLSAPMLARARARVGPATSGSVATHQADIREIPLDLARYDVVVSAATLHHLRSEEEWLAVFGRIHAALKPGGSFWVSDLVTHSLDAVQALMWARYGEYLREMKGAEYRDQVFEYIEKEDSPRPLMEQLDLLRAVGFRTVEVLHKNAVFAAYGAVRG